MTVVQALRKARALIVKGWCKGASARLANNAPAHPKDRNAARFCAIGATMRVQPNYERREPLKLALRSALRTKRGSIVEFNDSPRTRKVHVVRLFDRAIKAASS